MTGFAQTVGKTADGGCRLDARVEGTWRTVTHRHRSSPWPPSEIP